MRGKKKLLPVTWLEREICKLDRSVNFNRSPLTAKGRGRGSGITVSFCTRFFYFFPVGLQGLGYWRFMWIFVRLLGSFMVWAVFLSNGLFQGVGIFPPLFLALWPIRYTPCVRCRAIVLALFNIFYLLLIKKKKKKKTFCKAKWMLVI